MDIFDDCKRLKHFYWHLSFVTEEKYYLKNKFVLRQVLFKKKGVEAGGSRKVFPTGESHKMFSKWTLNDSICLFVLTHFKHFLFL